MAATVVLEQQSGLEYGAIRVAKTIFYFVSVDDCLAEYDEYPIRILSDETNYSYEVWLRFRCDVAPNLICNNFKIWTLGEMYSGMNITVNSSDITDYLTPSDDLSVVGTRVDLSDYTSDNKLSISGSLSEVEDKSNWMIFQLEVFNTAENDDYGNFEIIYQYDES